VFDRLGAEMVRRVLAALSAGLVLGFGAVSAVANPFDGQWRVERSSTECPEKGKGFSIRVVNGAIGGPRPGRVEADGSFTMAFQNNRKHYYYRGKLGVRAGQGTWDRKMFNGRSDCGGALTLRKVS
jgi:hypothetical protein